MNELHNNLRKFRDQYGKTQAEIADKIGVSRQTYTAYELGTRIPPKDSIFKLAELYRTTPNELYGWNSEEIEALSQQREDIRVYEDAKEESFKEYAMSALGSTMRSLREEKGISLVEAAEEFKIPEEMLTEYENGTRRIPRYMLFDFAEFYGVEIEDVIALQMETARKHTVITTSKKLGDRYKKWQMEIGYDHFTDAEIDEIIDFAKYVVWKRKSKK